MIQRKCHPYKYHVSLVNDPRIQFVLLSFHVHLQTQSVVIQKINNIMTIPQEEEEEKETTTQKCDPLIQRITVLLKVST